MHPKINIVNLGFALNKYRENCKFGTPNVAFRGFAIPNIDLAKLGLETLSSCKSCH
jgi:hypothetical protein